MTLLQFVELFERKRVDGAEQTKLAFEITNTSGSRDAFGQLWHFGCLGSFGLKIEFAAQ